jgi:CubicO group peptidase (beta-lactamase class C family)
MFHKTLKIQHTCYLLIILLAYATACKKQPEKLYPDAENQNIDRVQLTKAFASAEQIGDLQGLAVARNGVIVAEEYFNNATAKPDLDLHVMSVTKSITSTLVGIAMEMGFIGSVDQTISDYLGAEVDTVNPDLGKVTIHQLLTMACGHDWHELGGDSEFGAFASAPDQLNYVMEKPVIHTPGTIFNYSDGGAHLASAVLTRATEMETSIFADKYLFEPMGLGERTWHGDNRHIAYGGVGLCIGIHDMLEIGFMYLNHGHYNGRQIVPAAWIEKATSFQISSNNEIPFLTDYGYYWWLGNAHGHNYICANGYGGQFIFIVKDLDLVVCSRSNFRYIDSSQAGQNWYNILDIIINQVLPAVREE